MVEINALRQGVRKLLTDEQYAKRIDYLMLKDIYRALLEDLKQFIMAIEQDAKQFTKGATGPFPNMKVAITEFLIDLNCVPAIDNAAKTRPYLVGVNVVLLSLTNKLLAFKKEAESGGFREIFRSARECADYFNKQLYPDLLEGARDQVRAAQDAKRLDQQQANAVLAGWK